MQRIALLSLLVFALFSCEDLEDNTAIIQGSANDVFLKGGAVATRFDNGTVVISGRTDEEELTITLAGTGIGTYLFGEGRNNGAVFTDGSGRSFSTSTSLGDGEAIINESSPIDNTISGTFKFNAHTFSLQDTLNFQRGVFFRVPVIGGTGIFEDPGVAEGISATINDLPFEAVSVNGQNVTGFITVNGVNGSQSISLRFPTAIAVGTYDLAAGQFEGSYGLDGAVIPATAGTLTITSNSLGSGLVRGTFSISGPDFVITEGLFAVNF